MAATPLGLPPALLAAKKFRATALAPEKLFRISSYADGEPYFGRSGGNRFDAPGCLLGTPEYGACYLGYSLEVAVAESILHDRIAVDGSFQVANTTLANSYVHRFTGDTLQLLSLTGANLKRLNGHGDLSGTSNYDIPQQWALAVFNNPTLYDGFIYASRHATLGKAVLIFDRAHPKLRAASHTPLNATAGYAAAAKKFGMTGI